MQPFSELMSVSCKRLRPSRPFADTRNILVVFSECDRTSHRCPNFVFVFLQIRYYSFEYFRSFRYSEIKKQGWVTSPVIIFSYFCTERFKNETWVLLIAAEKNYFTL